MELEEEPETEPSLEDIIAELTRRLTLLRHANAPLVYNALDASKREIRLARLSPSTNINEPASCTLEVVSLDDDPEYEALSYAWGEPYLVRAIQLDSIEWWVTHNLEAALRYLRDPGEEMVFWIDAICINQADISERNAQIQFMKEIYSKASNVRVWLGEAADESDMAIDILEKLGHGTLLSELEFEGKLPNTSHLNNIAKFCKRLWWKRVWVQQEVSLARQASLHCGLRLINMAQLPEYFNMALALESEVRHGTVQRFGNEVFLDFIDISLGNLRVLQYAQSICYRGQQHPMSVNMFITLLKVGRGLLCSNAHDKIYGFLGLAPAVLQNSIKHDYNIPVAEVY